MNDEGWSEKGVGRRIEREWWRKKVGEWGGWEKGDVEGEEWRIKGRWTCVMEKGGWRRVEGEG